MLLSSEKWSCWWQCCIQCHWRKGKPNEGKPNVITLLTQLCVQLWHWSIGDRVVDTVILSPTPTPTNEGRSHCRHSNATEGNVITLLTQLYVWLCGLNERRSHCWPNTAVSEFLFGEMMTMQGPLNMIVSCLSCLRKKTDTWSVVVVTVRTAYVQFVLFHIKRAVYVIIVSCSWYFVHTLWLERVTTMRLNQRTPNHREVRS